MIKIQYKDENERQTIVSEKELEGIVLIQEINTMEGNYLVFGEIVNQEPTREDYLLNLDYRLSMIELGL